MTDSTTHPPDGDRRNGPGYEARDASVRPIFVFTGALALLCLLALGVSRWVFVSLSEGARERQPERHPLAVRDEVVPGPALQANPSRELAAYLLEQERELSTYGWVDPDAGVVQIPLERALELVVEEGLPARVPQSQPPEEER